MSDLLARAVRLFVDSAPPTGSAPSVRFAPPVPGPPQAQRPGAEPSRPRSPSAHGSTVAVLAAACDLDVVAGGVAAGMRSGQAPLVCTWDPEAEAPPSAEPGAGAVALPSAVRAARRLGGFGLTASARGGAAWVRLDPEPIIAAAEVRRLDGAGSTVVLALARRHRALDPLLREADRVVVAVPPGAVAGITDLAVEQVRELNRAVELVAPPTGMASRTACRLALWTCGAARSPS